MEWNEDEYETVLRQFRPRKPSMPSMPAEMLKARPRRRGFWIVAAAAVILLGILSIPILRNPQVVDAADVEVADGSVVRVSGENTLPIAVGERIGAGGIVRSAGGGGAVLRLKDGTHFEVRYQSEFSLERTDDGLRINLHKGSLIIDAAKQIDRRLSVKTKDLIVFSVGTVFLVTVEEEGSRVAVIEGEVRVQQGVMAKNLGPGEQLTTSPRMESLTPRDEISWSRNASKILLLFPQPSPLPVTPASRYPADASAFPADRVAFKVSSIRPMSVPIGGSSRFAAPGSCTGIIRSDARRFDAINVSIYQLVLMAYGQSNCDLANRLGLLSGGPEWLRSEKFTISALLPEDLPALPNQTYGAVSTASVSGSERRLERMLQTLLEDRFKLVLRRESKEMPVYLLTVAKGGHKLRALDKVDWETGFSAGYTEANGDRVANVRGAKASMANLAADLASATGWPVLDRTGINGKYDYRIEFAPTDNLGASSRPNPFTALQEQLGLHLEAAKEKVEVLTVERIERPSPN